MKRAAVTGAHGYVGSRLIQAFQRSGWAVVPMTRRPAGQTLPGGEADFPFILGNEISSDELAKRRIDVLVHAAYDFSLLKRPEIDKINVQGSACLFRAAQAAGIRRIIVLSSLSAFEGAPSFYGQAKLAVERLAQEYGGCAVRAGLVYGEAPGGMMGRLQKSVEALPVTAVLNHTLARLHLVHEEDLGKYIVKLSGGPWPPLQKVYTAAGLKEWTLRSILEELASAKGRHVRILELPWQLVWFILRAIEAIGITLPFHSDSVRSLTKAYPPDVWASQYPQDFVFREFGRKSLIQK